MQSVNKVILIGNVGRDPEIRHTTAGAKIASFSIATSDTWKDKDGQRQERTEWHRIVVWNKGLAELVEKYVRKGSAVYIEGALQTRKWQDKDGSDKYSTEVVIQAFRGELKLLDKADKANEPSQPYQHEDAAPSADPDDEIPF